MVGEIWDLIILQPMINSLIVLSSVLFSSFGLTIIVLTIVIRGAMYPLSVKQIHASKAMQELQPKLLELQKKYARDKQKLAQEQMRLYKESKISPMGCMVPMLIQLPVWIALYQSIIRVLAVSPEDFLSLSHYLYSWPIVYSMLPLNNQFLWLNLAAPDTALAILVGGTMWLQQKMVMPVTTDPRQRSQSTMMLWMMPLMFSFFALSFPSGLALYWVASNVITIVMQYFVTGQTALAPSTTIGQTARDKKLKRRIALQEEVTLKEADIGADITQESLTQEEGLSYGESGNKRQDSGRGYPSRPRTIRHQPGKGKGHRPKRR